MIIVDLFKVVLTGYVSPAEYKKNRINIDVFIAGLFVGAFDDMLIARYKPLPKAVADGVSDNMAYQISRHLQSLGCIVNIEKSEMTELSQQEEKAQRFFAKANAPVLCPRCGSSQITTGTKGYGLIRGFLGSNKTVNRCGKCGYSWEP